MLTRKARIVGNGLVVTLPSQLCEMYDIKDKDEISITYSGDGMLTLKKINSVKVEHNKNL